ncbi:2-hydroxyacid dehydrogenase [Agaribacterium haliotis]|uniref:2-hydroxyacid dehydrogenase n=1 Tax=Agaribacterium haliotis TaxID=2013869 RepID=UPI000BB53E9A|nr:2-hydroxyacid dehydrogenase [Agaribacterium haliotis]
MRVAVFNSKDYDKESLGAYRGEHEFVFFRPALDEHSVAMARGFDAVCCFVNDDVGTAVVEALAELGVKLIAMRCAGYNNVDLEAAKARGITVCRVPEYSPHTVAEHAVALIMDLNRNIHRAFNRIRENDYSLQGLQGFEIHGKTVGVIGTGIIGSTFANLMSGFGCRILGYDPGQNERFAKIGDYVELDKLLNESDIVSLHCPLLPATRHIVNADSINKMKDGVMIINTSRGALVDTPAVIDALKTGKVGWLGLDVYEDEAGLFFEDNSNRILTDDVLARLLTFPNVVITGHQAFFSREALKTIADTTIANVEAFAEQRLEEKNTVSV